MITVFANPVVNFSVSNTEACAGEAVNFNDLTVSVDAPIIQWVWDFGDGFTSTQQHPIHVYQNPGTYSVVLEVLDANGCNDGNSITNMITIYPSPTVAFTATPSSSCSFPMTVTFQDQSTGSGITGYLWDFGDGTTSTQQHPVHTYTTPGSYTATLTVTGSNGCSGMDSITFSSNGNITADFQVDDTVGCGSVSANFTDQSTSSGTIVSWAWNFGDGGTSTAQNSTHNYTVPGTYDVTLTITDNNGCSDDIIYPDLITVYARPTADFSADQTQGCALPFTVNFTETSSGEVSYFWEFGDGQTSTVQNPSHTYASSGNYGVRLTVTSADGCTATSFKANHITITTPTADFATSMNSGCTEFTVNFADQSNSPSPITNWFWDFDNGSTSSLQNPSHDFTTSGTYNVKLVIETSAGCIDSVTKAVNITLDSGPAANFTVSDNSICLSETVNFTNTSVSNNPIVSWHWDFGDGSTSALQNPSHHYSTPGTYDVTLTITDDNGCTDTIVHENIVTVNSTPQADFTSNQAPGCALPVRIDFTEMSTEDVSWFWDFGDGNTSSLQNPFHDYAAAGTYNVMLVVTNAPGCRDTIINPVNIAVNANLVADFTISDNEVCINEVLNFSDASVSAGTIISWQWNFGDGSNSTLQNPSHSYAIPGTYDVTLTVIDDNGCSDVIVYNNLITVYPSPVSDFTSTQASGCSFPFTVNFTETAIDDASWFWDFGDGNSSALQNPSHDYAIIGTYNVQLIVTNAGGCSDTLTRQVSVTAPNAPVANFTANDVEVCIPENIGFTDASTSTNSIVSWQWNFGDGGSSALQNPSHIYTTVDTFTVTLVIETNNGCRDTISKTVTTNGPSIANAGADQTICAGDSATLTGSGGLVYSWSPSSGLSDPLIADPFAFPTVTTTFTLTVFDSLGCSDTDDVTVTVHPLPLVNATPTAICRGNSAQLSASGGVSYSWSPGSTLNSSNISNPIANPDTTTLYTVTVNDINGCVNSANTTLVVHSLPVVTVSASNDSICSGQSTQLTASGGVSYSWSPVNWLDNPDISNPVSTPLNSIAYTVTVTDNNGCQKLDSIAITVNSTAPYTVSADTTICPGDTVGLFVTGGAIVNWHPASGLSCTNCNNPDAYPAIPTTYYVDITDAEGCAITDSVRVTVFSAQAITITNDTFVCEGGSVQLSASGGVSYEWSPAAGLDDAFIQSPQASPDSNIIYKVRIISASGCVAEDSVNIEVKHIRADMVLPVSGGCTPSNLQFTDQSSSTDPIVSWQWDFGDGNSSNQQNPLHSYSYSDTFAITLTVTGSSGCTDTTQLNSFFGSGTLNADFSADVTSGCESVNTNFTDLSTATGTIVSWQWDFGDGVVSALQHPSHTYSIPGTYDVALTITDSSGCTDVITYEDLITVDTSLIADFTSAQNSGCTLPIAVNFTGIGTDGAFWSWDFDDGNSSNLQNPTHNYDAPGVYDVTFVVTNTGGCSDTVIRQINIAVDSGLVADFSMNDLDVCIPETISFSDISNANGAITSWQWDFGDGATSSLQNPNHTFTTVDTFTVTLIIESSNGCQGAVSKPVVTNGPSIADAGADQIICSGDSVMLLGSGGLVYSWSPSATLSDPYIADPFAFPTVTTTYTLTVFDSLGCADTDEVTVIVHDLPRIAASPASICLGDSAQLSVSGGVSYIWSPASALSDATISNPVSFADTTTTYSVTVTDANGCVNSVNATLVVHPLPTVTVSASNNFICSGQSTQLNATGGVNYSWLPATWLDNPNVPNPVATPLRSVIYTVTATDYNGCKNQDSIGITVTGISVYSVSPDTSICKGDTISLAASGGTSINWQPASGLNCTNCNNPEAYPDSTTTYYAEISDTGGCTISDSVTVTVFSSQAITVTNDTFVCKGGSVQLNALGGINYVWSPAAGLDNPNVPFPVASPDTSTTYTVQVISPSGCRGVDSVRVEVSEVNAAMSLSENTGCLPLDVQFTDHSGSDDSIISWLWDFGNGHISSNQHPFHVFGIAGTHVVELTVTNSAGCVDSVESSVVVHGLPDVSAGPDTAICGGGSVQLHGSGGIYYNWSPSVGLNAIDIPNPVATPNVTRYYELIVTDANGCVGIDSVLITVNDLPVTSISSDVSLCKGDSTQLQVTGGNAYSWTPAAGLNDPYISDPIAKPESTTTYVVHIETGLGCDAVDSVTIEVYPKPLIIVKAEDQVCFGDSTQFNISGAVSYEWSPLSGLSCSDCSNAIVKPLATTTYALMMTDEYGCTWRDTFPLVVSPLPEVHTSDDKTICKGEEVELTSQQAGANSFEWLPAYGLDSDSLLSPVASPQQTTEYIVIARNEFGCDDRDTVTVNVIERIQASVTDNQRICRGSHVTLDARIDVSAGNETSVIWLPADAFDNPVSLTQTVSPAVSTTYSVIAFGGQCVPDTQYVHVHVDENPDVDAGENQVVMAGTEVSFTATSNYYITSYRWDPSSEVSCSDCQTSRAVANDSRTYYVYVTDANGCLAMDSVNVTVIKSCDGDIWLPNSFTPNGDEVNDEFRVRTNGFVNLMSFRIFGRWGNLIFETDDINQGWDGKYKGEWVTPDVYVWWVRATCSDGQVVDKKGNVTIVR